MAAGTSSQDPDDVVEISEKNYQKITETFVKVMSNIFLVLNASVNDVGLYF